MNASGIRKNLILKNNQSVISAFNQADFRQSCIHHLFEAQVRQTPDAVAAEWKDSILSYQELNSRANQLAHYLLAAGVKSEEFIAVCMERSAELMAVMLGIFKAGAAYLPLDPGYPQERLEYMFSDSGAKFLLTTEKLMSDLPNLARNAADRVIFIDREHENIERESEENPNSRVKPENLAYCIYTSGSTGKPKGVLMEHLPVANLIAWYRRNRLPGIRMLQYSPMSFDVSLLEIIGTWFSGGTLVIVPEDVRRNPFALLDFIAEKKIERMYLPFIGLQQVAEALDTGPVPASLREVITAGEQLQITPPVIRFFSQSGCMLYNQYGSTECLEISAYTLKGDPETWPALPPVGTPIDNIRIYILDPEGQPVSPGASGEICAGGPGIARGYLNRPDLTKERFIPNPFGPGRLYKTGDLGRLRSDGNIECLGRADRQIKIRGFRVEPGEIEVLLSKNPLVRKSAVIFREDVPGQKRLTAYIEPNKQNPVSQPESELRDYLKARLPEHMIPSAFVILENLPRTPSGKTDRRSLPPPDFVPDKIIMPRSDTEARIAQVWREILKTKHVGIHDNFFELGGNSLLLLRVQKRLMEIFGAELRSVTLFQYPTVSSLSRYLSRTPDVRIQQAVKPQRGAYPGQKEIAVIGMSCRFPGAGDITAFWQNLQNGVESVSFFSDEEIEIKNPELLNHPDYVKAGAILPDIDLFDAAFFGYTSAEARMTDPQQRLLLECAWETFENAGYNPENIGETTGVCIGSSMSTYLINKVAPARGFSPSRPLFLSDGLQIMVYNDRSCYPMRISYKLNLRGPSLAVQTTCSTSLVAVHEACRWLITGECDIALAGGAAISVPQKTGYLYQEGMIFSPDGHCRAFDAKAGGTLFGSGVGLVLLKPLDKAVSDGDHIYAVIKSSAVNNDGALRADYNAPGVEGQAAVISRALADSGIDVRTVTYVEAHGTGTRLGDPVEIEALAQAFQQIARENSTPLSPRQCAVGSVKTNIGHTDEASGIAGLIKTVLALKHGYIPPSLHFEKPNPEIDFAGTPFYVNTELKPWKSGVPRRAGVSAFGMGGTNCHVILEQAPETRRPSGGYERDRHLLALSGKSPEVMMDLIRRYADYLGSHPDASLADICFTANTGRRHFDHRFATVAASVQELETHLRAFDTAGVRQVSSPSKRIAFLFTGQGAQYANMGCRLYETHPGFRRTIERCRKILKPYPEYSLVSKTAYPQPPALFALEYALAELWQSWGIMPNVIMGHSLGEYAAACAAGVFSLEDGLRLVAERSRLMDTLPRNGTMSAVFADESRVIEAIQPWRHEISIAAVNGPEHTVISGLRESVDAVCAILEAEGIRVKALNVSHGFHSPLTEPLLEDFRKAAREVNFSKPEIGFISNLTGLPVSKEIAEPEYWVRHIRQPVRFRDGMQSLNRLNPDILIEIGPKPVLLGMGRQCLPNYEGVRIPSLSPGEDDWHSLLSGLARIYISGAAVDWLGFDQAYSRYRLPLPTYPFQRQRYWTEPEATDTQLSRQEKQSRISRNDQIPEWLYEVKWHLQPPAVQSDPGEPGTWFIFVPSQGSENELISLLRTHKQRCIEILQGETYKTDKDKAFLNPHKPNDFRRLFSEYLSPEHPPCGGVIWMWGSETGDASPDIPDQAHELLTGVLHLVQALTELPEPPRLWLITRGAQAVLGSETLNLAQSPLWGLARTIAAEHPELSCVCADLDPGKNSADEPAIPSQILFPDSEDRIAFRNGRRYAARLEKYTDQDRKILSDGHFYDKESVIQKAGTYLITGGTGGLGLKAAEHLANLGARYLVLTSRSGGDSLQVRAATDELKTSGVSVTVIKADVSSPGDVNRMLDACPTELRGIIHAAGILDDGVLRRQTPERFARVTDPKVRGAWRLHTLTREMPLDFFVCFSSAAAILDYGGQGSYAAANAFMDALAHYRHNRGLPALSINWGSWSETGMSARMSKFHRNRLHTQGEGMISPDQGMRILFRLLKQDSPCIAVLPVDWTAYFRKTGDIPRFLSLLHHAGDDQPSEREEPFSERLSRLSAEEARELLLKKIQQEARRVLGLDAFQSKAAGLSEMGMDSLTAIEMRNRLQKLINRPISLTAMSDYPNPEQLADYLFEKFFDQRSEVTQQTACAGKGEISTLVPIQPLGSKPRMFFIPGIMGTVFDFRLLSKHMGPEQPFYALRSAGLDEGESPYTRMSDIAARHIRSIQQVQPRGPYLIGGHSFGCLVAYEMARQLQSQNQQVSLLILLDPVALRSEKTNIRRKMADDIKEFARLYSLSSGQEAETLRHVPGADQPDEMLNRLAEQLNNAGYHLTPADINRQFQVFKANTEAEAGYSPKKACPVRIKIFQARELLSDFDFLPRDENASLEVIRTWQNMTALPVEVQRTPGNHFTMLQSPHVKILAGYIESRL
jgi:amino acid adenylation domain-containing protein